jgi:hypothetical protein
MTRKRPQGLSGVEVPHLHERIPRRGQDAVAVNLHGVHRASVALQDAVQLARRTVPHVRLCILRGETRGQDDFVGNSPKIPALTFEQLTM